MNTDSVFPEVRAFFASGGRATVVPGFTEVAPRPISKPRPIPADEKYHRKVFRNQSGRASVKHNGRYSGNQAANYLGISNDKLLDMVGLGLLQVAEQKPNSRGFVLRFFDKSALDAVKAQMEGAN